MNRNLVLLCVFACARPAPQAAVNVAAQAKGAARVGPPIEWIENDPARALATAKRTGKPLFVDVGATWCHTCRHMEATVFTDESLRSAGDEVVWLRVDVDDPRNEPFLRTRPTATQAFPTFLILNADGTERSRWVGAMDAAEVSQFVLTGAGASVLVSAATSASMSKQWMQVVRIGEEPSRETARSLWERLALATLVSEAHRELSSPERIAERASALLANLIVEAQTMAEADLRQHADDVSSAFEALSGLPAYRDFVKKNWAPFLEAQAQAATTKEARAAFDPHRVLAYLFSADAERALPMLEQSRREFPNDFNPPARLARVYMELGRLAEALEAITAARALVRGPRMLRVLEEQARILVALGRIGEARTTLIQLADYEGWLPEGGQAAKLRAERQLAELEGRPAMELRPGSAFPGFNHCKLQPSWVACERPGLPELQCDKSTQALQGKKVLLCHGDSTGAGGDLPDDGCMVRAARVLVLSDADGGGALKTKREVSAMFPPRSPQDALALAMFLTRLDGERGAVLKASASGAGPYTVVGSETAFCGCSHPVHRVTLLVSQDGAIRETGRAFLKNVNPGLCVD